jgi:hypothetical protein
VHLTYICPQCGYQQPIFEESDELRPCPADGSVLRYRRDDVPLPQGLSNIAPALAMAAQHARRGNRQTAAVLTPLWEILRKEEPELLAVLNRIFDGEQSERLLLGLSPRGTVLVRYVLDHLTEDPESPAGRDAFAEQFARNLQQHVIDFLSALAGDRLAMRKIEMTLQAATAGGYTGMAAAERRILAGERGSQLLDGLPPEQRLVISAILDGIKP